ncbi:hypothetical protein XENOCAPTIV_030283, partial [Xenoophorus captivus]
VEFLRFILPPNTDPAFFDFLRGLDCSTVTVRSVPEGSVVFARVRFWAETTAVRAERISGANRILTPTGATDGGGGSPGCGSAAGDHNAARFRLAAGHQRKLLEMGLRRAQGPDGGLTASRYTHIGGFDLTSNVQAGFLFGIPVAGTMAHSYVTSFSSLEEVWPQANEINVVGVGTHLVTCTKQPSLGCVYKVIFETEMGMLTGPCRVKICIMLFVFQAGGGERKTEDEDQRGPKENHCCREESHLSVVRCRR